MRLLENRVAVVTGATRGIGLAIARTFASHGASLVIAGTNLETAAELRQRRLILINESEIRPSPLLTRAIWRAVRRHRQGLALLIAWSDIGVRPSRDMHRRYVPGEH